MDKIDNANLLPLLTKYRQGNLLPEEEKMLEAWFASLQETKHTWYQHKVDERAQLNLLWKSIQLKTTTATTTAVAPIPLAPKRAIHKYWWTAAATLAGIFLLGVWIIPRQRQDIAVQPATGNQPANIIAVNNLTVTASFGTVRKITLPDHSMVILNSGASLQYPEIFNGPDRKVRLLKGQAFFEVTKDSLHPFIVQSAGLQTQVLGTSFEINTKATQLMVAVATGKVKVSKTSATELGRLLPGKKLTYTFKGDKTSITDLPVKTIALWRNEKIKLEHASFATLAEAFETIYGVELKAADSLVKEQTYTIVLQYNTSLKDMAAVLAAIHNNEYNIHHNTVLLKTTPAF